MFDHRLGLALGMTVSQVHKMSYVEYKSWQTYYMVEPFGFHNDEYMNAALLAQIRNAQAQKKSQIVKVTKFIRNVPELVLKHIRKRKDLLNKPVIDFDLSTPEDREQASNQIIKQFEAIFGKRVQHKDK